MYFKKMGINLFFNMQKKVFFKKKKTIDKPNNLVITKAKRNRIINSLI